MASAEEIAQTIPLVTVTSLKAFEEGRTQHALSTIKPESTARQVEDLCELDPGKYFFAALAEPDFGGVALVYAPEVALGVGGSANPYDTGGTLKGKCRPFDDIEDDNERKSRVKQLLHETLSEVPGWRHALHEFLEEYYSDSDDYVRRVKPDQRPEGAPEDLPALHEPAEADPRSWMWEVRLYSEVSLTDNLKVWACDDATETKLKREASSTALPSGPGMEARTVWQRLNETEHIVRIRRREAFDVLHERIEYEVLA